MRCECVHYELPMSCTRETHTDQMAVVSVGYRFRPILSLMTQLGWGWGGGFEAAALRVRA